MVDIFLSYARGDFAKAEQLAAALERQGWSVFWDTTSILAGEDFDAVIEQAIDAARCMIVIWSELSKTSHYVRDEARRGRDKKILVPIQIQSMSVPMGFGSLHTENFAHWNGEPTSNEFIKLQRAVERLAGTGSNRRERTAAPKPENITRPDNVFIEPEMVEIPASSFQMGSEKQSSEQPVHKVTFARPFNLARYPVTFNEYDLYAKSDNVKLPSDEGWNRGNRPVINVSWEDASSYANWLAQVTGKPYRLPTEAEWEYAARAGTCTEYYWDDKDPNDYAWFGENANKTQPVAQKQPNDFGLYDMSGNVWEWVQDCWHKNYQSAPKDGSAWLKANNGDCTQRVMRGGSWLYSTWELRSAFRYGGVAGHRSYKGGFRLAQD